MQTVYLVQETVDLGSHTISAWANESDANNECTQANAAFRESHPALAYLIPFWVQAIEVNC